MSLNAELAEQLLDATAAPKSPGKAVFAASIGNAVEWFDWSTYTTFAIYFSKQFFPAENDTAALLATFAVFAVGFAMRPLGGWVVGAMSDRLGRRSALSLTVVMMAGSSLLISILPTYQTIGILAPILMTGLRMVQGLALGGEYGAATTFIAESSPSNKRAFHGSFLFVSIAAGLLVASGLATVMTHLMSKADLETWGWRIPFAIGGAGSLVGLWIRRNVGETEVYEKFRSKGEIKKRSLWWIWTHHRGAVLRIIGICILGASHFYLFVSFMPIYAIKHAGARPADAFLASTASIAIFMISQPLFGAMSDRFGRRPQLILYAALNVLFLYPVVTSISSSFFSILAVMCFGLLTYGLYSSTAAAVMAEQFSTEVRGIGIGVAYNLVVTLLGGTTPYLMAWLQSHNREGWFLGYVSFGAFISLITYLKMPETRGRSLE